MAALPQCIQSAKQLYDVHERYKDTSVLITAFYSESMVIAASLSQVQNLLQHDALLQKPQLLETFDRALTGCRVVYGCLQEEVQELVEKAQQESLKFKDRARFLWKEATFKELLTQIRGQQSALSLLIQGLQMESMADIRKLVEDNSSKLDHVVKRSKTLRQSHPRVEVPESIFDYNSGGAHLADAQPVAKFTQFDFDDQVINSKVYQRAMVRYTLNASDMASFEWKEPMTVEIEVGGEDSTEMGTIQGSESKHSSAVAIRAWELVAQITSGAEADLPMTLPKAGLDDRSVKRGESNVLPHYMARDTRTTSHFPVLRADTFDTMETKVDSRVTRLPLRSFSEGSHIEPMLSPPLPSRCTGESQLCSGHSDETLRIERSKSSDESLNGSDTRSLTSRASEASSHTAYESMHESQTITPQPFPPARKASCTLTGGIGLVSTSLKAEVQPPSLKSHELHTVWLMLVESERNFFDRMTRLRKMFYDKVTRQWPALGSRLSVVIIGDQLAATNKRFLWLPMEQQLLESDEAVCDPAIFSTWTDNAQRLLHEYCQALPSAIGAVQATQIADTKFAPFLNTLGLSVAYFGKSWEDYLRLPLTELDTCIEALRSMIGVVVELKDSRVAIEVQRLTHALDILISLRSSSTAVLDESQIREDIQRLECRIQTLKAETFARLELHKPGRRILYQGEMTMKLKGTGPWHAVHVVLLDNYLLWGKINAQRKGQAAKLCSSKLSVTSPSFAIPC